MNPLPKLPQLLKCLITIGLVCSTFFSLAQQPALDDFVTISASKTEQRIDINNAVKKGTIIYERKMRFDYLLANVPQVYALRQLDKIKQFKSYFPDTAKIASAVLEELSGDSVFMKYFQRSLSPFLTGNANPQAIYTKGELMEVASKFFYCDKVTADTSVRAHICVGLNGVKEARWPKDYTLLAAFCYEAIFTLLRDNQSSQIEDIFVGYIGQLGKEHRKNIVSLDDYLIDVRLDMFERIKANELIQKEILTYYEQTQHNLAFRIEG